MTVGTETSTLIFPISGRNVSIHLQNPSVLLTEYVLPLTFGLLVMPEEAPFSHTVQLEASLQDVGEIARLLHSGWLINNHGSTPPT